MTLIDNSYYFNKYDIVLLMMVCLMSYEQTSCTLLDPMTDEGKPNIKLFIKAILVKITVIFLFTILLTG